MEREDQSLQSHQSPVTACSGQVSAHSFHLLGMIEGCAGLDYVLPGILMENDSDLEQEDGLDMDCLQTDVKLELESRIKTEIPDSCSDFFRLVTSWLE